LEAGKWPSDSNLTAVTHYLVEEKPERGHWQHRGSRPPSSGSDFTTTYVALRGLAYYGSPVQVAKLEERKAAISKWLREQTTKDTEDAVFQLKSLSYVDLDPSIREKAIAELLQMQRDDGGWSQNRDLESDAYATATVVETLLQEGKLEREHRSIRKGIDYLLKTQLDDGTWRVTTRAKPFQEYFESGFPHGADQFISISATAWSALALVAALPETGQRD
jgi:N-acyl-D-amino-acid deacylase